jgi:hypothetical protein
MTRTYWIAGALIAAALAGCNPSSRDRSAGTTTDSAGMQSGATPSTTTDTAAAGARTTPGATSDSMKGMTHDSMKGMRHSKDSSRSTKP